MIRLAQKRDIPYLQALLRQILTLHANGRPDIFKQGTAKYTESELLDIIDNQNTPVFVYENTQGEVVGYAFCQYHTIEKDNILNDTRYLYIDDLCVDESYRGRHIGAQLFAFIKEEAQKNECQSIRLNVWKLNEGAIAFYQKIGFLPLSFKMEYSL